MHNTLTGGMNLAMLDIENAFARKARLDRDERNGQGEMPEILARITGHRYKSTREAKEMANQHTTLLRKLSEVAQEVGTIAKLGHNEKQNYDYAREADFKRAVRAPFFAKGFVLTPEILSRTNYAVETKSGSSMQYVDVTVKFTVSDSETGESLAGTSTGTGFDSGDKAVYKALAGAMKYWLAMTFMIPTGDDPEDDSEKKNGQPAQTTAQKPTSATGAAQSSPASVPPIPGANTKVTFGKYKDKALSEIFALEPGYIDWLAGDKNDKPYGQAAKTPAIAFLAAQPIPVQEPNWPQFWMDMRNLGLSSSNREQKEFINREASIIFKTKNAAGIPVIIDDLISVVKSQASLDLLSNAVADAVMIRDGSTLPGERMAGED
jgi:hypothetical protein